MEGPGNNPLISLSEGMADVVEKMQPSVVRIEGGRRWPSSGIVYAEDLVLAANHAIEREEDLSVQTDSGRRARAEVIGRDNARDLALLKVESLAASASVDISDTPARVGSLALALGRPSEEGLRANFGIVSAVGSLPGRWRRGRRSRSRTPERYIQADIATYPGLAGGPLVSASGRVLGVVVTGFGRASVLAVPSDVAWSTAERLKESGSTKRGYLGIYSQPVRLPDAARLGFTQEGGLLVAGVGDDTPASRGGLIIGDILATVDNQPVEDTDDLLVILSGERVGKTIPIKVVRGGELRELSVTVGERE